jgi:hypothetical protein
MTSFLNEVQLQELVPSVFAVGGAEHVSSKYGFIPTIDVVRGLKDSGFHPVSAMQSQTRLKEKINFVKHIMRFRHESQTKVNDMFPEIVLVNSHDGTTSYQLRAGIYRIVCSNGMIVGDNVFCRRVKHQGDVVEKVVEAANDLIEIVPISVEKATEWKTIILKPEHKIAYAESAMSIKWEANENNKFPVDAQQLLSPRRLGDTNNDLWTTFNVVQENMIRGGLRYRSENGARNRTRAVNSVGENVRLNTALWSLTEKMSELMK